MRSGRSVVKDEVADRRSRFQQAVRLRGITHRYNGVHDRFDRAGLYQRQDVTADSGNDVRFLLDGTPVLRGSYQARMKQIEIRPAVHLTLDQLKFRGLPLGLAVCLAQSVPPLPPCSPVRCRRRTKPSDRLGIRKPVIQALVFGTASLIICDDTGRGLR